MGNDVSESLAESIDGAGLETLQTTASERSDEDSFADIVSDVVHGEATAQEVENRLVDRLNELVDIPYVPESLEDKVFDHALDALKVAVIQLASRLDDGS